MLTASQLQAKYPFKLGKLSPTIDERTLKFASVAKPDVKIPETYSVDVEHKGCVPHMFLNDTYGCCVLSCRCEYQLRLDFLRTGEVETITDAECEKEYFKESGGEDAGLNVLSSLRCWRSPGWKAAGKIKKIHHYTSVDCSKPDEVKRAIYTYNGLNIGVALPDDAMDQFMHGKPWASTKLPPSPEGGHCIYFVGYTKDAIIAITWGAYQSLSLAWLKKYTDEAYGVVDDPKNPKSRKLLDFARIEKHLVDVT